MKRYSVPLILLALAICLFAGCGGSAIPGDISDVITSPTNDSAATPTDITPPTNGTGSLSFSIVASDAEVTTEALRDRFEYDDVPVGIFLSASGAPQQPGKILTDANPTAVFAGIPADTVVYVEAGARRNGVVFTSKRTPDITIVKNVNTPATLVLPATIPTFANQSPANSPPVTSSSATVSLSVTDPGGKIPTSTITVDGTAYGPFTSATPSVTVNSLADGVHTVAVSSNTPSGGFNSTSWSFTVSTTGGINVGISELPGAVTQP